MKYYITLLISILIIGHAHGQNTLTVNNDPDFVANGTTTFSDLQTAIDYATAGDVIYVVGTPYNLTVRDYGTIEINKQLHIIGDGYYIDPENGITKLTRLQTINLNPGSSNTTIEGVYLNGYLWAREGDNTSIDNITIRNCYATRLCIKYNSSVLIPSGWNIENNVINLLYGSWSGNYYIGSVQIKNNIILSKINLIRSTEPIITNNLFVANENPINGVVDATFTSNIFYTSSLDGCTRCSFYNNLVYDPFNQASLTFNYGDNISDDTNIENVDPNFVNATAGFSWEHDYHLQAGSPALTAGPGATEIGIYSEEGSPFPETYGPNASKVTELKVEDLLIEPGQQIQIRVKAEN